MMIIFFNQCFFKSCKYLLKILLQRYQPDDSNYHRPA